MIGVARFLRSQGPALLALFVALGGTAYASGFPANVIGTKQLRTNAVTPPKLAPNAVDGSKVANDSITGADVREGSLAVVAEAAQAETAAQAPSAATAALVPNVPTAAAATNAADAPLLSGLAPATFQKRVTGSCSKGISAISDASLTGVFCGGPVGGSRLVLNAGQIVLTGSVGNLLNIVVTCHFGGKVTVGIKNITPVDGTLNWLYSDGTTVNASGTVIPSSGTIQEFSFAGKRLEGQFIAAAGQKVDTVKLHAIDFGGACEYQAMMVGAE